VATSERHKTPEQGSVKTHITKWGNFVDISWTFTY